MNARPDRSSARSLEAAAVGTAGGRGVRADGGYERIPLDDRDRLETALSELEGSEVTVGDDRIELESGSARLVVTRDGTVEASMPLHSFASRGIDALYVDTGTGRVQVRDEDGLEYEFRNP